MTIKNFRPGVMAAWLRNNDYRLGHSMIIATATVTLSGIARTRFEFRIVQVQPAAGPPPTARRRVGRKMKTWGFPSQSTKMSRFTGKPATVTVTVTQAGRTRLGWH